MLYSARSQDPTDPLLDRALVDKIDDETGNYLIYKWSPQNILSQLEVGDILQIDRAGVADACFSVEGAY
jgi:hypothetical protein